MDREERMNRIMNENIEVFRDWARHILFAMEAEFKYLTLLAENDETKSENDLRKFRENMKKLNLGVEMALKNIQLINNAKTIFCALGDDSVRNDIDVYMATVASNLASNDALKADAEITQSISEKKQMNKYHES